MVLQCCVCKQVRDDGEWKDSLQHDPDLSHTYCPTCAGEIKVHIENRAASMVFQKCAS